MKKPLPARPSLTHLKSQAKDLLDAYRLRSADALARFRTSLPAAHGVDDAALVEQKLAECIHGLGRRDSANLYDLLIGLVERPLLRAVLRETGGNQLRAAALLGINRNTLRKKLRQLGLSAGGSDA